jgi:hypothetical protein
MAGAGRVVINRLVINRLGISSQFSVVSLAGRRSWCRAPINLQPVWQTGLQVGNLPHISVFIWLWL